MDLLTCQDIYSRPTELGGPSSTHTYPYLICHTMSHQVPLVKEWGKVDLTTLSTEAIQSPSFGTRGDFASQRTL